MSKFRKIALAAAAMATPALCLAEGETTPLDTALQTLQTDITGALGKILLPLVAVVGAAVAIWAIPMAWRKMRGGAR